MHLSAGVFSRSSSLTSPLWPAFMHCKRYMLLIGNKRRTLGLLCVHPEDHKAMCVLMMTQYTGVMNCHSLVWEEESLDKKVNLPLSPALADPPREAGSPMLPQRVPKAALILPLTQQDPQAWWPQHRPAHDQTCQITPGAKEVMDWGMGLLQV